MRGNRVNHGQREDPVRHERGDVDIAFKIVGPETGRRVVLVPGFVSHLDFAEEFGPTRALLDAASVGLSSC